MEKVLKSEKETLRFAKDFAKKLKGGEVIALIGDLGAGKTVFAKGLAGGLGLKEVVSSPTFLLMKRYILGSGASKWSPRSQVKYFCHIDAYRLESADELRDIGVLEHLAKTDTVTVIEWADRVPDLFKDIDYIEIRIKHGKKEEERVAEITK